MYLSSRRPPVRTRAPHCTVNGYGRKVYGHLRCNQYHNRSVYWSGNSLIEQIQT
ncbi:hypothetical protein M422DRAFT_25803, partial [Sphaerobolus stellatus SS14]